MKYNPLKNNLHFEVIVDDDGGVYFKGLFHLLAHLPEI